MKHCKVGKTEKMNEVSKNNYVGLYKLLPTVNSVAVNSVATNVNSVAAVNSVAGFSAKQKATELTVESF